ncbi:MAG: hypothetical protein AVDCRST_MAG49-3754, partial [uncultured Thermomicrobiales bacterium]
DQGPAAVGGPAPRPGEARTAGRDVRRGRIPGEPGGGARAARVRARRRRGDVVRRHPGRRYLRRPPRPGPGIRVAGAPAPRRPPVRHGGRRHRARRPGPGPRAPARRAAHL